MSINAFEGARRILLLVQILWVLGVALVAWTLKPTPTLRLDVRLPGIPPTETTVACDTTTDAEQWTSRTTAGGHSVSITLCFRATDFPNGAMLIPFRVDDRGSMWGDGKYSESVTDYTRAYARGFELSPAEGAKADSDAVWEQAKTFAGALAVAVAGWGILWLAAWVIGWIVRGFAGIPRGRDSRPQQRAVRSLPATGAGTSPPTASPSEGQGRQVPSDPMPFESQKATPAARVSQPHLRRARHATAANAPTMRNAGNIAGWLVVPAVALILGCAQLGYQVTEALASRNLPAAALTSFWLACGLLLSVFFFRRHRWAPGLFIGLQVMQLVVGGFFLLLAASGGGMTVELFGAFLGSFLYAAVWVPYFVLSKRVKLTFVR